MHKQHRKHSYHEDRKKAQQHYYRVAKEILCENPKPKVIHVQLDPSKSYVPSCTILHRCGDDTGCCKNTKTCQAIQKENVDLYFTVTVCIFIFYLSLSYIYFTFSLNLLGHYYFYFVDIATLKFFYLLIFLNVIEVWFSNYSINNTYWHNDIMIIKYNIPLYRVLLSILYRYSNTVINLFAVFTVNNSF